MIITIAELKEIFKTDKEKFVAIQNAFNELNLYDAKYGISIDNVKKIDNVMVEFYITVPEHSELKSERDFEMCGIYLANQFKTNATNMVKNLYKILGIETKLPIIKIKYASVIGSKLTESGSTEDQAKLRQAMEDNIYYPFNEELIY